MRQSRFGASARSSRHPRTVACQQLRKHIAVDANVASLRLRCQRQGERVNAGLDAQRQAVTKSVNPLNDGLYTALSAHDLQHEAKDFLFVFGQCCSLYKYAVR